MLLSLALSGAFFEKSDKRFLQRFLSGVWRLSRINKALQVLASQGNLLYVRITMLNWWSGCAHLWQMTVLILCFSCYSGNKSGILYKKGKGSRDWKARWFILDMSAGNLSYYKSTSSVSCRVKAGSSQSTHGFLLPFTQHNTNTCNNNLPNPSVRPSVHPSIHPSIYPSIYLYLSMSISICSYRASHLACYRLPRWMPALRRLLPAKLTAFSFLFLILHSRRVGQETSSLTVNMGRLVAGGWL